MKTVAKVTNVTKVIESAMESMLTSAVTQPWSGQTSAVPSCGVWSWGGADGASTIF